MKTLKIEAFSGISGDMMLAALVDLNGAAEKLQALPGILGFSDVTITIDELKKCGIRCTDVNIEDRSQPVVRHLRDILKLIADADLPARARTLAVTIFNLLGEAEASVHGISVEKVHFHEVGAVDSIIDIVGSALLLTDLDHDRVVATPICIGSGFIICDHGKMPVPAPATEVLLQGMPTFPGDIATEMTTPTGAAILRALDPAFNIPILKMVATGYGAGDRDFEHPNCLRLGLGESSAGTLFDQDRIWVIQANLDDCSGELLGHHFQELLFANGAVDLSLCALTMKKGRPGQRLEVLCPESAIPKLTDIILCETSTIGVRYWQAERRVLSRTYETVRTRFGDIRLKCVKPPSGEIRKTPEYEDCRRLAIACGVSVQQVMSEALLFCGGKDR